MFVCWNSMYKMCVGYFVLPLNLNPSYSPYILRDEMFSDGICTCLHDMHKHLLWTLYLIQSRLLSYQTNYSIERTFTTIYFILNIHWLRLLDFLCAHTFCTVVFIACHQQKLEKFLIWYDFQISCYELMNLISYLVPFICTTISTPLPNKLLVNPY